MDYGLGVMGYALWNYEFWVRRYAFGVMGYDQH